MWDIWVSPQKYPLLFCPSDSKSPWLSAYPLSASKAISKMFTLDIPLSLYSPNHHDATAPSEPGLPHYLGCTITLRQTTVRRTPLDEWTARLRDRNLTQMRLYIQGVPGVKVNTSGYNSRADSESKTPYTHGPNSQRFRSYEFLNYIK